MVDYMHNNSESNLIPLKNPIGIIIVIISNEIAYWIFY